jgi:adenine phosphoribosyltransferase
MRAGGARAPPVASYLLPILFARSAAPADAVFDLKTHIAAVPDFPKPGILFRDIMPLLRSHFGATIDALGTQLSSDEWAGIDAVIGIESRGFILAAALATKFGKGFVPVRKAGKLPPPVVDRSYKLEYGEDRLEMQKGTGRALLVDDVLATGGTLATAGDLCQQAGYDVTHLLVLIDLRLVPDFHWTNLTPRSVVQY